MITKIYTVLIRINSGGFKVKMKRIVSLLLSALMLVCFLPLTAMAQTFEHEETFTIGDADGDGEVNMLDLFSLKRYLSGYPNENFVTDACDFSAKGSVSMPDLLEEKKLLAGYAEASDYETGYSVNKLTIGGADISEFSIYLSSDITEDDNAYYAATELQKYVKEATGVNLSIARSTDQGSKYIAFHKVDYNSELGQKLGVEGYTYTVSNGNLDIYGTLRGNMYFTYMFCEEYLGFRFYTGEYTYEHKLRVSELTEGTSGTVTPRLNFRFAQQYNYNENGNKYNFYFTNRMNGTQIYAHATDFKYGTLTGPQFINAHSYGYYYRMATGTLPEDGDYHKKYLSGVQQDELAWLPCATNFESTYDDWTNEWDYCDYDIIFQGFLDTMKMMFQWGKKYLFEYDLAMMSFSNCDNENYCRCRDCRTKMKTEGASGLYVDFANKGARDVQEYYPGMKLMTIIYNHYIPETVRPDKNLVIMYCGNGCNQHALGSGGCGDNVVPGYYNGQPLNRSNKIDEQAIKAWTGFCHEVGTQLWFWYYPVNFTYKLIESPINFNLYYDFTYMINECGIDGIYYEGGGNYENYGFASMRCYMAMRLMHDPGMTYDEYIAGCKEYLRMYFGPGYESIYQYMVLLESAADQSGSCFINNCSGPGEMYSYKALADNYETMRSYVTDALELAENDQQTFRIEQLLVACDFMGLSVCHNRMYTNGTAGTKEVYKQRYTWMYNFIKDQCGSVDPITDALGIGTLPETISFEDNPFEQFYTGTGSQRSGITFDV